MRPTASEMSRLLTDMRDADLARHLGVSRQRISQIRTRAGIPPPPSQAAIRRERAVAALAAGTDPATVATELGVSLSTIERYRSGAGLRVRDRPLAPCGTRSAYERHRYHGETPCAACREANRVWFGGAASDARRLRVVELLTSGRSVDEVAAVTGMHSSWVRRYGRAAGVLGTAE